jgi:1,4-dihydroxy-2-naphthoate octaprenyltransferase
VSVDWGLLALAVIGLVVAHAANNMINDFFDLSGGVDTEDYVRAQYAPHPILSGWVSKRQLGIAILVANAIDLAIMLFLAAVRGPLVIAFALAGLFISVFYVAPPIRLKHIGLGEPGVFVVWGPLMVAGTFFVGTGELPGWVWLASLPYAILVTTVLFGKHIDKIDADAALGIRTLPVILGESLARRVAQVLMVAFYPIVIGAALVGFIGPWVAVVLIGVPRLLGVLMVFNAPRPEVRRTRTSAGRCGSSAPPSSTLDAPVASSSWACSSTRWCRSVCPGCSPSPGVSQTTWPDQPMSKRLRNGAAHL